MLKAIVFDLDHTLYDRYATFEKTLPETYESLKDYLSDDLTYDKFKELMIYADKQFNYDGWPARLEYFKSKGALKKDIGFREFRLITYEGLMKYAAHFDYTLPLLKRLRDRGV